VQMTLREAAKVLSKAGAAKGGRARAKKLTPKRQKEIASNAAKARWAKRKQTVGA
jgi:hypothetical protein